MLLRLLRSLLLWQRGSGHIDPTQLCFVELGGKVGVEHCTYILYTIERDMALGAGLGTVCWLYVPHFLFLLGEFTIELKYKVFCWLSVNQLQYT